MSDLAGARRAGLLIPLFSCPSTTSWGVGDIGDLASMTRWMAGAKLGVLQLLPINEMAPGQSSPYSAISAMAIDPLYIDMSAVPEFAAVGGESSLDPGDCQVLNAARRSPAIDYAAVRQLKRSALRAAFERFVSFEWNERSDRATDLRNFVAEQAWWVDDHALFRALHAAHGERPWSEWPDSLQRRNPTAIASARRELAHDILFNQYLQWIAHGQWQRARARTHGVALFGDLPFMVDGDSADVWARQEQFRLDASIGVPPDAFSADGQNWGMPLYQWDVIAADDYRWLRERARRSASLYDGYRIDHLVGFYRTYARPKTIGEAGAGDREGFFTPATEAEQLALGEHVLDIFRDAGAEVIAEDLGTVPDFVRASLARLGVPGFRVLRWERYWDREGQPFRDPADYPPVSVATSGTHDTEPLVAWWETATDDDRRQLNDLPTVQRLSEGRGIVDGPYIPTVRDVLLESLYSSASNLVLVPVQDVFGWPDRINQPATVTEKNWTFRLPWPADRLDDVAEARERRETLARWSERHARTLR